MVDYYGRWTYDQNTPDAEKTYCDRVAERIMASGYKPKTSIENMTEILIDYYIGAVMDGEEEEYTDEDFADRCMEYGSGSGLYEFDYWV